MLVSLNFVDKFINLPKIKKQFSKNSILFEFEEYDTEIIVPLLTKQGFEVEEVKVFGNTFTSVVVGKIEQCEPHPNANKLQICQVYVGQKEPLQIVCGGQNARVGIYVAVALIGTKLSETIEIKESEIRQVKSMGMLCSRAELGLPVIPEVDGNGIWEIHVDSQGGASPEKLCLCLGQPVFHALNLSDIILDISVTPNRPDMLSHEGVARELYTGLHHASIPCEFRKFSFLRNSQKQFITSKSILDDASRQNSLKYLDTTFFVENFLNCPTFFMALNNIQVAPSPAWIRNQLEALGQNSVNNVVDASNFILLAFGQPNHAFDLDKISECHIGAKKLVLRHAKQNEKFVGLDAKERELHEFDCVVADTTGVQALLGVLGGNETKVSSNTKTIVVEFANPDPVLIRRASRRHGRRTDASFVFEKGIDASQRFRAAAELYGLLSQLVLNENIYLGTIHSKNLESHPVLKTEFIEKTIDYSSLDQKRILGTNIISYEEQLCILKNLGFSFQNDAPYNEDTKPIKVLVPSWRSLDVVSSADLVEEFIRVVGIDKVPSTPIYTQALVGKDDAHYSFIEKLCVKCSALGYNEVIGLHFMRADDHIKLGLQTKNSLGSPIEMLNPILGDEPLLHTTLVPDLLRKVAKNLSYMTRSGQLFYSCRTFQNANSFGKSVFHEADLQGQLLKEYSFEHGYTYCHDNLLQRPVETPRLAGICFGNKVEKEWHNQGAIIWQLHDVMSHVYELFKITGAIIDIYSISTENDNANYHPMAKTLHSGRRVGFSFKDQNGSSIPFGWCGEFHPKTMRQYDIDVPCIGFEVNVALLLKAYEMTKEVNKNISTLQKFPPISRDFAFLVSTQITAIKIEKTIEKHCANYLKEISTHLTNFHVFDIYVGKNIEHGKQSITFRILLEPQERTLTDTEIQTFCSLVISTIVQECSGELRGTL